LGGGFQKEKNVKCPVCKKGETSPGKATVTLERGGLTLVVKEVPAQVCDNCGEQYVDEKVTAKLLSEAEESVRAGTEINVRHYLTA
jgi:YgiT-type zinc finger domain-containing protein